MNKMKYSKGFKYQLTEDFVIDTGILVPHEIDWIFVNLKQNGTLTLKRGFCSDGVTGIPDFSFLMIPAYVHDGLYALLKRGLLGQEYRKHVDKVFRDLIVQCAAPEFLTKWFPNAISRVAYFFVRTFGGKFAKKPEKIIELDKE